MNHSPAVPVIPGRCERDRNTDVRQMQATHSLLDTSNDSHTCKSQQKVGIGWKFY